MHRKPQLQEAARKLQERFNTRTGDITYVQALEIISELEGFEGYQQLRDFVAKHSQHPARTEEQVSQAKAASSGLTALSATPRQTLAMALCVHGGFSPSNYKRISTGAVAPGDEREISFTNNGSILRALADEDAGVSSKTQLSPDTVVAYIKTPIVHDAGEGTGSWALTVADFRAAKFQTTPAWRGWSVRGVSMVFWDMAELSVAALLEITAPNPQGMSRKTYIRLSDELERIELDHAMGQDTDDSYLRAAQIDTLLDASPWCRDMDNGRVVLKNDSIYGTRTEPFSVAASRDVELEEFGQRVAQGEVSPDAPFDGMNREWTRAETHGFHQALAKVFSWKSKDSRQ